MLIAIAFGLGYGSCILVTIWENAVNRRKANKLSRLEFLRGLEAQTEAWRKAQ